MTKQEGLIQEDWEREHEKETLYAREREIEMMNDWWQYECQLMEKRLPAKITVIVPKEEENESLQNNLSSTEM